MNPLSQQLPFATNPQVLVVDDDPGMRIALESSFRRHGWKVETAGGLREAVEKFRRNQHRLVVTDIRMPDGDGLTVMREVRGIQSETAVVLLTAYGSVPDAVSAIRSGACDYLMKPVSFEQLERTAQRVLVALPPVGSRMIEPTPTETQLIGRSPALLRVLDRARQIAPANADILIQAESGTGKELLARMIHGLSPRRLRPFVAVNCAAFPESLLESELFGHTKGAFTGALAARMGKFEMANGGTLLLDEIGEMPLALQPKLLRVVQEREIDRLGDTRTMKLDIRVIATTNRSLEVMVKEGSFRQDLFYRLNVIPLTLPSLRERPLDIPELAEHFARLYCVPGCVPRLSPEFLNHLQHHAWPGNVRELANLMRRAVALSGEVIGMDVLEPSELDASRIAIVGVEVTNPMPAIAPDGECLRAGLPMDAMEKKLLTMTLDATGGNRSQAAEMLGISLRTVRNKIREYGLPARRDYAHDTLQHQHG